MKLSSRRRLPAGASCRAAGPLILAVLTWLAGDVRAGGQDERGGSPGGTLVIVGGGGIPDAARRTFIELAGGPKARIVVIPTAAEDAASAAEISGSDRDEYLDPWRTRGATQVSLLHTRSRQVADTADFTRAIDEATGVWFGGGDQSRITDAYLGTATEKALRALLARGGVIGGTSAGAAIMSRVMITGGQQKATVGTGFGFLPGAVVDQHALRRSRVNRLLGVLADHPDLAGVAIDEATALVVRLGPGRWRVVGASYVVVCRPGRFDVYHDGDEGDLTWKKEK